MWPSLKDIPVPSEKLVKFSSVQWNHFDDDDDDDYNENKLSPTEYFYSCGQR